MATARCRIDATVLALAALLGGCAGQPGARTDHAMTRAEEQGSREFLAAAAADADEIWIIERSTARPVFGGPPQAAPAVSASLTALPHAGGVPIVLALERTAVHSAIRDAVAMVDVSQRFANPLHGGIDAEYVLILPLDASVTEFIMSAGERRIRGIVRDRGQAEFLYREAHRQGYSASRLLIDSAGSLRAALGNIAPGAAVGVDVRYFQPLRQDAGGGLAFSFPLTIAGAGEVLLRVDLEDQPIDGIRVSHDVMARRSRVSPERVTLSLAEPADRREAFTLHFADAGTDTSRAAQNRINRPYPEWSTPRNSVLSPRTAFVAVDAMSAGGDDVRTLPADSRTRRP
jgi:hypothetical protein